MGSTEIITAMILICVAFLVLVILAKPLRLFLRFFGGAVVGGGALALLHSMGLAVGANVFTIAVVGALGLPGFLGLVVLSFFL